MVSYIKGTLEYIGEDYIIIDNNNVGYELMIPLSTISNLPPIGEELKIFTYLYVRDDAILLYGFISNDDLYIFKLLLTVNGIGPKSALSILSTLTPDSLRYAILTGDDKAISKSPGVGKKTAQRLIIDLKDKIKLTGADDLTKKDIEVFSSEIDSSDCFNEAVLALVSLGYTNSEALKATKSLKDKDYDNVEDILKEALKQLARI